MRTLGIDPGSLKSGYGVVDEQQGQLTMVDYGVIRTKSDAPLAERLLTISQRVRELIDRYVPDEVAVEEVFMATNAQSSLKLGQARGAILLTAAQAGVAVAEYTPLQVKQSVVGYGRAEKTQVQQMVKVLLRLTELPTPDDAADALAIAICHHHSVKMNRQLAQGR